MDIEWYIFLARIENAQSHTPTKQRVLSRLFDHLRYASRFSAYKRMPFVQKFAQNMFEIPEMDKKISTGCNGKTAAWECEFEEENISN